MKRTHTRVALLAAVVLLIVPVAMAAQISGDEFSIELPSWCGDAQKQAQKVDSPSGPIDVVTYVARGEDGAACIVTYSELSGPITDAAAAIDSNRDSLLKQLNVQLENESEIEVSGFGGRSINFTTSQPRPVFGRTDFVVADDRLYQVIYIGYTQEARQEVERSNLFSSLQITAPEPAEVADAPEVTAPAEASADTTADNGL